MFGKKSNTQNIGWILAGKYFNNMFSNKIPIQAPVINIAPNIDDRYGKVSKRTISVT